MTDEIKPALTADEWARMGPGPEITYDSREPEDGMLIWHGHACVDVSGRPHALAAALLYGQPFGFTREDVETLCDAAGRIEGEDHAQAPLADRLMALADRIEALLPPA